VETVKEGADGRRANVRAFTTTDIGSSDPAGVSVSCALLDRRSWATPAPRNLQTHTGPNLTSGCKSDGFRTGPDELWGAERTAQS